jgi:H+/Cl- antiporter ClcA
MAEMGRWLIFIGLIIAITGVVILMADRLFPWLNDMPGNISFEGENYKVYIPLGAMILVSVIGTIILNIILRIFRN